MADFPQDIGTRIASSRDDKTGNTRVWDLCSLFVEGRQWLDFNSTSLKYTIDTRVRRDGSKRQTVNLLLNIYRNILSRLTLSYPSVVVVPASPSNDDIIKAKTSEIALRYYWSADDIEVVMNQAIQNLLICGTVGLHTFYDSSDECVHTTVVNPYDLFFEKNVTRVEDSQWVAIRTFHIEEDVKKAYPDKADQITSFSGDSTGSLAYDLHTVPDDRVELFEIYWRDGRHAIVNGDTYLYKGERHTTTFPVQVIKYTELPGRLWGLGLVQPLLDLQRLYNEQRTQIIHNVQLMGNPKYLIPKTSGVNAAAITNKPGEKIFYNPAGGAPSMIQPAPMPGYVQESTVRTQAEMYDVAGIHSVSLGKRAVGVSSGKAMQVLTERDTSQLQTTQSNIERAMRDLGKVVLELMQMFYTEPKMARMLDQTGRVAFQAISSETIVKEPEIFIEAGSAFRFDSQDRDRYVMDLFQAGLIQPEDALKEMSFRTGNSFITERVQAMAHAQKLLDAAKQGFEIEVFRSDDLRSMLKVFNDYIREDEFYELPEERQLYLRDIVVALANPDMQGTQYQQAQVNNRVFPKDSIDNEAQMQAMIAAGSPSTQAQIADSMVQLGQKTAQAEVATQALDRGTEALIGPLGGGMG